MGFATTFLYSQFFVTPPYPTTDFTGKTIIVTGSNTGLGFEAARHIARLNFQKLILAVRTISNGEKAKASILESTERTGDCIQVWQLDLSSSDSVKAFADKARQLERVDVLVENAGVLPGYWEMAEGNELTLHTNVVNTFLLALLMLPKLQETQKKYKVQPCLAVVTSELAEICRLSERNEADIYGAMNEEKKGSVSARYGDTKLLQILFMRELANHVSSPILTTVNPGFCYSEIGRQQQGIILAMETVAKAIMGRTTEVGSRTLVAGACAGEGSHGQYMSDGVVADIKRWNVFQQNPTLQKRVYDQTLQVLEKIAPGVSQNISGLEIS